MADLSGIFLAFHFLDAELFYNTTQILRPNRPRNMRLDQFYTSFYGLLSYTVRALEKSRTLTRAESFLILFKNLEQSKEMKSKSIGDLANYSSTLYFTIIFPLKIAVENHKITAGRLQIALYFLRGIKNPVFMHKNGIENGGSG